MTKEEKIRQEQEVAQEMIRLFCRKKHGGKECLCPSCAELAAYVRERTRKCPFMEEKTFCSQCRVHCYSPAMRERIREVMRFSGPRMIFHRPGMALCHLALSAAGRIGDVHQKAEEKRSQRK